MTGTCYYETITVAASHYRRTHNGEAHDLGYAQVRRDWKDTADSLPQHREALFDHLWVQVTVPTLRNPGTAQPRVNVNVDNLHQLHQIAQMLDRKDQITRTPVDDQELWMLTVPQARGLWIEFYCYTDKEAGE